MIVEHNQSTYNGGQYNNAYKFNGKELDDATQMYYYGARYYDPRISIFVSVDPLAEKYPGWTPYHYVHQNPINLIDPTGMSAEHIIIKNNTNDALTKLAKIAATDRGSERLNRLRSSPHKYNMSSVFWTSNARYDGLGTTGEARTVHYPSSIWRLGIEGGSPGSVYATGHEFQHAYDHEQGISLYDRRQNEISAVNFGNYLRSVYGEDDMRTAYSGLGLKFSNDPSFYNLENEKITDFNQTFEHSANGNTFLGFNYNKSKNGKKSNEYIISVRGKDGSFNYHKYDNEKEYKEAYNRIKDYGKD